MNRHAIGKLTLGLNWRGDADGLQLQEQVSRLIHEEVVPALAPLFDRLAGTGTVIAIERLDIDLGVLPAARWREELLRALAQRLEEEFLRRERHPVPGEQLRAMPLALHSFGQWLHFLENGRWPQPAAAQTEAERWQQVLAALAGDAAAVERFFALLKTSPAALQRLLRQHSPDNLQRLAEAASGRPAAPWAALLDEVLRLLPLLPKRQALLSAPPLDLPAASADRLLETARQARATVSEQFWLQFWQELAATGAAPAPENLLQRLFARWLPEPERAFWWHWLHQAVVLEKKAAFSTLKPALEQLARRTPPAVSAPKTPPPAGSKTEPEAAGRRSDSDPAAARTKEPPPGQPDPAGKPADAPPPPPAPKPFDPETPETPAAAETHRSPTPPEPPAPAGTKQEPPAPGDPEAGFAGAAIPPAAETPAAPDPAAGRKPERAQPEPDSPERQSAGKPLLQPGEFEYVENAGMVLLHPFLPAFLAHMGLTSDKIFIDENARERAVYFLHFLASGAEDAPEYELLLPKLLCAWPAGEPLRRHPGFSESEKQEAQDLLRSVVRNWSKLGNTSPGGLREGFLKRPGKLSRPDAATWLLQVEQSAIDILLQGLPWGIGVVKLPWMPEMLYVEWNF